MYLYIFCPTWFQMLYIIFFFFYICIIICKCVFTSTFFQCIDRGSRILTNQQRTKILPFLPAMDQRLIAQYIHKNPETLVIRTKAASIGKISIYKYLHRYHTIYVISKWYNKYRNNIIMFISYRWGDNINNMKSVFYIKIVYIIQIIMHGMDGWRELGYRWYCPCQHIPIFCFF